MKVNVRLRQIDRLGNEEKILADTGGLQNGNRILYPESKGVTHTVTFTEDEIILERKADVISRTVLSKKGGRGTSIVDSEYGRLEFETKLNRYETDEAFRLVEYQVLSQGETVLDQILIWEITPIS